MAERQLRPTGHCGRATVPRRLGRLTPNLGRILLQGRRRSSSSALPGLCGRATVPRRRGKAHAKPWPGFVCRDDGGAAAPPYRDIVVGRRCPVAGERLTPNPGRVLFVGTTAEQQLRPTGHCGRATVPRRRGRHTPNPGPVLLSGRWRSSSSALPGIVVGRRCPVAWEGSRQILAGFCCRDDGGAAAPPYRTLW